MSELYLIIENDKIGDSKIRGFGGLGWFA